ncbi:tetratricopeptide repeat protein 24-like [Podarcis raffonei]|uniref:tetratricopeptide repeat protein 24-like n=1 Tax=Podarcis raffonei TaxID=65483 RepID=UPI002329748D|nr:tetratricopeptide repeat protein 24-like [Podarcis raffonei]
MASAPPISGSVGDQPVSQLGSVQTEMQRLLKAGICLFSSNEEGQALAAFKKAYRLSGSLPEPRSKAKCLFNLGAAYIATSKPQKGLKCLLKAKELGAEEKDGDLSFNMGAAYDDMREYAKAAEFYGKAIQEYSTNQTQSAADALIKLAYCLVSTGDVESAAQSFRLAGQAYQRVQLPEDAAMAMREAANYFLQSPVYSPDDVLESLQACSRLCTKIRNQELLGKLYNHLGLHYAEMRCFQQAEQHFDAALQLCSGKGFSVRKKAVLLQNLGAACNALECFDRALRYHSEAADMYGALGERAAQAQCHYNLATAHGQLKNYDMAGFYSQQALKAFVDAGDSYGEAQACEQLGMTHLCQGHFGPAIRYYKQALALFEKSKEASEIPQKRIWKKLAAVANYQANAEDEFADSAITDSLLHHPECGACSPGIPLQRAGADRAV